MIVWWLACAGEVDPAPEPPTAADLVAAGPEPTEVVKPGERRADWANARCNDGTPFAYLHRPGVGTTWVVNLAGGYFCEDERQLCSERKRRLVTTRPEADGAPASFKGEGVFSIDPAVNPTFASAHAVDAHYCSSDLWLGDSLERRPNSADAEGWYFSGRENVRVLFASLAVEGLNDDDPETRVLIVGTSAGGAGVVGNLDTILAALPKTRAGGRLRIVLDGSWVPPPPPGQVLPDAARWGPVHPACDAALRARGEPPRNCVLGPVWWPYMEATGVPVLVQLSGLDRSQTPVFGVDTPEEQAAWQASTRATLESLPWVFSGGNAYHVVAIDALFAKGASGRTFREVLDRFWAGEPPEQVWFGYPTEAPRNGTTLGK